MWHNSVLVRMKRLTWLSFLPFQDLLLGVQTVLRSYFIAGLRRFCTTFTD